jgi:hypothetical protein
MVQKRAPGGGRKPKGPIAARSQLTVRMPDDLRIALEANVARRQKRKPNWNLTEEVLGRLYWSYRQQREERRDPYMRAIGALISAIAEDVHKRRSLSSVWHRDPFLFRAFKHGVAKLLDALDPPGEAKSPLNIKALREEPEKMLWQKMADWYETPEALGNTAAESLLRELYRRLPLHPDWGPELRKMDAEHPEFDGMGEAIAENLEETFYSMSNIRRVLGIKEFKEPRRDPDLYEVFRGPVAQAAARRSRRGGGRR